MIYDKVKKFVTVTGCYRGYVKLFFEVKLSSRQHSLMTDETGTDDLSNSLVFLIPSGKIPMTPGFVVVILFGDYFSTNNNNNKIKNEKFIV